PTAVRCLRGHGSPWPSAKDVVTRDFRKGSSWPKDGYGFGQPLLERGYVVLAPHMRHEYQFSDKQWTPTGERVWDCLACLHYLCTRVPEVDRNRLGVLGLSMGGETAMYVGALDERIKVVVSCGTLTTIKNMEGHCGCWRMRGFDKAFEYSDVFALIAPRHLVCENSVHEPAGTGFPS